MKYDILIIGSGPGGYVAGIRAAQLGKKVGIIERSELGGICLNWGCIPAKSLLKSAYVLEQFNNSADYGINAENYSQDFTSIIKRSRDIAVTMSHGVGFLLKKNNIDIIEGTGKLVDTNKIVVNQNDISKTYSAANIIIATGARARGLPGINIDGKNIIGYKEALVLKEPPRSMIIVGSGAVGVEFAYIFNMLGTQVRLIEYLPNILPLEDEEISKHLARSFKKRGIKIMVNSAVRSVETIGNINRVFIDSNKGEVNFDAEVVLSAAGISPNIENIGIEDLGIITEDGFIKVDDYYQTSLDGIYAIGDVIKGPALAHVASAEGIICVEKITGLDPEKLSYENIPSCTYTHPEVASVGLTEKEAVDAGLDIKAGRFMFTASGKANAEGSREGMVKMIFNKKDNLLVGAHIIGENATEMIAGLVMAKKAGMQAKDIINSVFPHPTMSEAIMEAAADADRGSIHV